MKVQDLLAQTELNDYFLNVNDQQTSGNVSLYGNIEMGMGKTTFTSVDYIELCSHAQTDSQSNAKPIYEALSVYLEQSLNNDLSGKNSLAIGKGVAISDSSIAVGCLSRPDNEYADRPFAVGKSSIALGNLAKALNTGAVSLGSSTASGKYSAAMAAGLAEGECSLAAAYGKALSTACVALGNSAVAAGKNSIATGYSVSSFGIGSYAEGYCTFSNSEGSHAEGRETSAIANYSHAEGKLTKSEGFTSHAEGYSTYALSDCAHAEGYSTYANTYSHSEGHGTSALGYVCHAEGSNNIISADSKYSHAEGSGNTLCGDFLHVAGQQNVAYGTHNSIIAGKNNNIDGKSNCIGGQYNFADGAGSFSYGYQISNYGTYSYAFGRTIEISSDTSQAFVFNGTAAKTSTHGNGSFNLNLPNGISSVFVNNKSLDTYLADVYSPPLSGKTYSMSDTYLSTLLFDIAEALGAKIID